jgi:hypothetical protein
MRSCDSKTLAVVKIAPALAQQAFGDAARCSQRFPPPTFLLTQIFLR